MSLVFSDSTNKSGVVELIDDYVDTNSTTYPIENKTRDINMASLRLLFLGMQANGTWQLDDANHTDYNIIYTNLVSGQRDYSFIRDEQSNIILDIYKVMCANTSGIYYDIYPVDQQELNQLELTDEQNITGLPDKYDKTANGIFLSPIPSYNYTKGVKIFINREMTYFVKTDTTKVLGYGHLFHEYLALRPAYMYALRKKLTQKNDLKLELMEMERSITDYYSNRAKDDRAIIKTKLFTFR